MVFVAKLSIFVVNSHKVVINCHKFWNLKGIFKGNTLERKYQNYSIKKNITAIKKNITASTARVRRSAAAACCFRGELVGPLRNTLHRILKTTRWSCGPLHWISKTTRWSWGPLRGSVIYNLGGPRLLRGPVHRIFLNPLVSPLNSNLLYLQRLEGTERFKSLY